MRAIGKHIDARAQSAAMEMGPAVTALDAAGLAVTVRDKPDADPAWRHHERRLRGKHRSRPARADRHA